MIDIVNHALEVSANGVMCVFVVHYIYHQMNFKLCKLA